MNISTSTLVVCSSSFFPSFVLRFTIREQHKITHRTIESRLWCVFILYFDSVGCLKHRSRFFPTVLFFVLRIAHQLGCTFIAYMTSNFDVDNHKAPTRTRTTTHHRPFQRADLDGSMCTQIYRIILNNLFDFIGSSATTSVFRIQHFLRICHFDGMMCVVLSNSDK